MNVDGARLRAIRLRQGFSQEQLAAKSGYGVRTIRRIEQGLHQPQPRTRRDLAEALGVSSEELCSEVPWSTTPCAESTQGRFHGSHESDALPEPVEARRTRPASRGGLYGVPRGLSMCFVGRESELLALERLLASETHVRIQASVEGLAGIGKTELALQLIHRLARGDLFPGGIFWLDAEEPDLRSTWGGKIADDLGIAPGTADDRCGEVLRRLNGERHRLLVVLDNAEAWRADALPAPVPQGPHVVVLVTTRERNLGGAQFVHLELGFLGEPHDRLLLQKVAGRAVEPGGAVLLRQLGGYALGIELAGAFLGTYPSESAASYLELLRQTRERPEREMTGRVRYERTVDDALRATWDRLEISERNAWLVAACFEPEPVSRALAEAAGLDAAARRSLERRHLLRSAQNGRWVMHRLIRDFGRRAGSEGERGEALERFVRGCFAAVSKAGTSDPELYSGDWPHLDSALRRASEVLDPDPSSNWYTGTSGRCCCGSASPMTRRCSRDWRGSRSRAATMVLFSECSNGGSRV